VHEHTPITNPNPENRECTSRCSNKAEIQ